MELTVIDDSDFVGGWNSFWTKGDISMSSVASMVRNVRKAAGKKTIMRLNIVDHGVTTSEKNKEEKGATILEFGSDRVHLGNFEAFAKHLTLLAPHFGGKSFVHLCHCHAGENVRLLQRFAQAWGVPVWAGKGLDANWAGMNFSKYVCVPPVGKPKWTSSRP